MYRCDEAYYAIGNSCYKRIEIGEEETAIRQVVINNGIGINKLGENKRNMRLECAAMTVKAYEKGDAGITEAFYLECKRELTGQSC